MPDALDTTLCICTADRPESLRRALDSVARAGSSPAGVLVSDDSADPGPAREVVSAHPGARHVRGPRAGVGANRNWCTRQVSTPALTFLDDDAEVPPEHFDVISEVRARHPDAVVSGRIVNHYADGRAVGQSPGAADFLGFATRPWGGGHGNMVEMNATVFPRSLFETAAFDPRLRYGYEELDISRQAAAAGYEVRFEPRLWVDHHPSGRHDDYHAFVDAARLYTTVRHYAVRQRRWDLAAAYTVLAPLHHLAAGARGATAGGSLRRSASDVAMAVRLLRTA